jgi:hypothetical protein
MRNLKRIFVPAIGAAALLTGAADASGGEGINLHVTNDGIVDIYVSVYDTTAHTPIIEHQRLNGFVSLPISASADDKGQANISWTTISVDDHDRHCGRGKRTKLENDATIKVRADATC